jgi:hypothetical protein
LVFKPVSAYFPTEDHNWKNFCTATTISSITWSAMYKEKDVRQDDESIAKE